MSDSLSSPAGRRERLRARFPAFGAEALLFLDMTNIRYLTGFTGSDGALLVGKEGATLLVDGRYMTQAGGETSGLAVLEYRDKKEGIAAAIGADGSCVVGFEAAVLTVDTHARLQRSLKGVVLKPLSGETEMIRAVKDEGEVACIREAAAVSCRALTALQDILKPGVCEKDIALELEFRLKRGGAEEVAFPIIVASGENAALPHARPGMRKLAAGDALVIDYGAVVNGYHCDETCTFVVGRADERQREAYALVKRAHDLALDAVRAGVACREIDRIARDCIAAAGWGANFSHGTGHGVGLAIHEEPRLAATSERVLAAGMVVTLEPGVYFPGLWGMRIEDTVLVQEAGYEILTRMPKDFTVLP